MLSLDRSKRGTGTWDLPPGGRSDLYSFSAMRPVPSVSLHNREIGKGVTGKVDVEQMAEHRGSCPVFGSQDWAKRSTNSGAGRGPLQH